ncbi:MAG TPA: hypothetical protein DCE78_12760 [Bacteroidetes bacterium]|nr:hypothetical protein [Bacteroidota bacterium]
MGKDAAADTSHLSFSVEQNSNSIFDQTQFKRCRVFRALTKIGIVLAKDVPEIFSGKGKAYETDLGGQRKTSVLRFVTREQNGKRDQEATGIRNPLSEWSASSLFIATPAF